MSFKRKKRILFVSEASYSDTGFGRYYYELISRLVKTDKYEIAELGCWGIINHPKDFQIKWKYYANQPQPEDAKGNNIYNSSHTNKVGEYRFSKAVIDFMPDIVISLRDSAMDYWINNSPLRKYFTWICSPPVDSAPQNNDFLGMYYCADGVVPYTDYGYEVIQKEAPNSNLLEANFPGLNSEIFKSLDSEECKTEFGLPLDKKIIGFVARNQVRKLFPHLIRDFKSYLDSSKRNDIILHLHTTYPDLAHWNLPKYLIENDLQDKVYFTFKCNKCNNISINNWCIDNTICKKCNTKAVVKNKLNNGPSLEELIKIYNCYDLYIQYVNAEGLGFPCIEAAMCGIPIMGIDYAAISDVLRLVNGIKIPYLSLMPDVGTGADRSIPNSEALVDALTAFFKKSNAEILEIKNETRRLAVENFDPDKNAHQWAELIDSIEIKNCWNLPKDVIPNIDLSTQNFKYVYELVYYIVEKTFPNDTIAHSYMLDEMLIRRGNYGFMVDHQKSSPFGVNEIISWLESYIKTKKVLEDLRCGNIPLEKEDFIIYAEQKEICHN